jgi:hypothetical protein
MNCSFLMPVKGLSLEVYTDIILVCSSPSWTVLLFPPKLGTGKPNEVPPSHEILNPQGGRRKLDFGITLRSVIFERIAEPGSQHLNEWLEI